MYSTLKTARDALEAAADKILDDYRTWVADDVTAKPRYGQIAAYDAVNAAVRECEDALCAAPTVTAQQCGQSGAIDAFRNALELPRWYSDDELLSAIRAYLEAATPPEVAGLIAELEAFAAGCRGSMWQSREETIHLCERAATTLEAQAAELAELREDLRRATEYGVENSRFYMEVNDHLSTERAAHAETRREREEALKSLEQIAAIEPVSNCDAGSMARSRMRDIARYSIARRPK